MLPFFSSSGPSATSGRTAAGVVVPPPVGFKPLCPPIYRVALLDDDMPPSPGDTRAKSLGLRYEITVQEYLREVYSPYIRSPLLSIQDGAGSRLLIPDGIFLRPGFSIVVEIKISHMPEAWWQLEQLYKPSVAFLFKRPTVLLEVVKSYDPAVPFPCPVTRIDDLGILLSAPQPGFYVHVWRP